MKLRTIVFLFILSLLLIMVGCGAGASGKSGESSKAGGGDAKTPSPATSKILVVYFSHSGNTREIAQQIQKMTGGDIAEIQTETPYPAAYSDVTKQAKTETEIKFTPALKPIDKYVETYDIIFVGSPLWWGTIAPPVASFLSRYDLSKKTVLPFITHGSSGLARSVNRVKELCLNSDVRDGIAIKAGNIKSAQEDVKRWVQLNGVKTI
jgi:flavodoxin